MFLQENQPIVYFTLPRSKSVMRDLNNLTILASACAANSAAQAAMNAAPQMLTMMDLRETGMKTVHNRTFSNKSKDHEADSANNYPLSSFDIELVDGSRGWIKESLLREDPAMMEKVIEDKSKERTRERDTEHMREWNIEGERQTDTNHTFCCVLQAAQLRAAHLSKLNNSKRTKTQIQKNNEKHNKKRKTRQIEESNALRNTRRDKQSQAKAQEAKSFTQLLNLTAELQSALENWPSGMLQDPSLDKEGESCLKGDIEIELNQLFHSKTNHSALVKCACSVCWELVFKKEYTHTVMLKYLSEFILPKQVSTLALMPTVMAAIPTLETQLRAQMRLWGLLSFSSSMCIVCIRCVSIAQTSWDRNRRRPLSPSDVLSEGVCR